MASATTMAMIKHGKGSKDGSDGNFNGANCKIDREQEQHQHITRTMTI